MSFIYCRAIGSYPAGADNAHQRRTFIITTQPFFLHHSIFKRRKRSSYNFAARAWESLSGGPTLGHAYNCSSHILTVFLFRNAFENREKIIKNGGCHPNRYFCSFVNCTLTLFSCQWPDSALRARIRRTKGTSRGTDESGKHLQRNSDHRRRTGNPKWERQVSSISL